MEGQIYKIHSDFYYVKPKNGDCDLIECKLREVIKKRKVKIKVGDYVELEENNAIKNLLKRKNTLERPSVSNIDAAVVISSLKDPCIDYIQLNRYLIFLKYHKIPCILCFNKDDLLNKEELELQKSKIISVYKPLGYEIVFTSALKNDGLDEFRTLIKGKTIVFCGQSGVGKSSVLNSLNLEKKLRTGSVSSKNKRGCHTTRHSEIIENNDFKIIDTPGFQKLTFDFILPKDLSELFDDIKAYKKNCKYTDCLHEEGDEECNVIENLDKIDPKRYETYLRILEEAKEFKQKTIYESQKEEETVKNHLKRSFTKISNKKRQSSRKRTNQTTGNKNFFNTEEEYD